MQMYRFHQACWLSLMIYDFFVNTNLWSNACFKFGICVAHTFLWFLVRYMFLKCFNFDFYPMKIVSHFTFLGYWASTSYKYSHNSFYNKSFLNWGVFLSHLNPPKGNFYDISLQYKLFISQDLS